MNRFEILNKLKEYMDSEKILDELVDALSEKEAYENLEHIIRMRDLPINL